MTGVTCRLLCRARLRALVFTWHPDDASRCLVIPSRHVGFYQVRGRVAAVRGSRFTVCVLELGGRAWHPVRPSRSMNEPAPLPHIAPSASADPAVRDLEAVREIAEPRRAITTEIGKRIVGQESVIAHLLVALFARGHCLFVGVPGLAKTLLIQTLSDVLALSFGRIQFTPDLMPSDITGTDVLEEDRATGRRVFRFVRGPLFANVILADEVNRTPPKTQAALLQSMQEGRISAGGNTYELPQPFLVFATQNPIEQEGTYPLPEAQLDRFMFQIDVDYPSEAEEIRIVNQMTSAYRPVLRKVLSPERILQLQELVLRVPVAPHVVEHAVALCRAS